MTTTFPPAGARLLALRVLVVIGGLVIIIATLLSSTSAGDVGDVPGAVRDAITVRQRMYVLPSGLRPGQMTSADVRDLKSRVGTSLGTRFTGTALTSNLSSALSWVDRVAADRTEGYALSFELLDVNLDPPVLVGGAATVTGEYTFSSKQAYDLPDGTVATYGGTYTNRFTLQLERQRGGWYVVALTDEPLDFEPNPGFESNLGVNPAPGATKPALESLAPAP